MFSHFLRKIEDHFIKELPFVVYRKGGQDEITAVFQTENKLHHLKNYRESGFVFAPFNDDKSPIVLKTDEVRKINHPIKPSGPYQKVQHPKIDEKQKNFHLNLIEKGMKEIQRGRLKKVVLSRALEVNNNQKPLVLFTELLVLYPNAFCYVWYHPKVGMWLGATPETLLQLENRKLTTMSLAGTLPVVKDKVPLWGPKEREEQHLVTEFIAGTLRDRVDDLQVYDTKSVRAGNLWHLQTSVLGTLKEDGLEDIIRGLHPTPAICGFPQSLSKDFILANEGYDRTYYAGFLGELNFEKHIDRSAHSKNQENKAYRSIKKTTHLFVNLRCMKLRGEKAILYMGGGITKDSIPEREWRETRDKSATMLRVLQTNNN